jgi:hypothetical protein
MAHASRKRNAPLREVSNTCILVKNEGSKVETHMCGTP